MSRDPAPQIRNAEFQAALDAAMDGDDRKLVRFLIQYTNIKSQPPSAEFSVAFGDTVAELGEDADEMLQALLTVDEKLVGGDKAVSGLAILVAYALVARIERKKRAEEGWEILEDLAANELHTVRDGVVQALTRLAASSESWTSKLLTRFASWTDGYLQGSVALDVLTQKGVLARMADPAELQQRLQECFDQAVDAPRSAARSQGRRRLIEVLGQVIPTLAQRFPTILDWFAEHADSKDPAIKEALETALARLEKLSLPSTSLDPIRAALDGARGARRDPTTYVGPTRGRGRKANKRAERK